MIARRLVARFGLAAAVVSLLPYTAAAQTVILNASYDVSRELYKEIDPAFVAAWKNQTGENVEVKQSHGGSTKQAQAVDQGLDADVVTLNQATDLDFLAKKGLIDSEWRKQFPNNAAPYTTTSVFLVRKGNPKNIKDWDDLIRSGVSVVIPNPKTSGNGRYSYLAAWGYAKRKLGTDDKAQDFVSKLFANVPVFDGGGRGATTTFTQRGIGDVLVSFENEAALIKSEIDGSNFDIVYPSLSIEAAPPVAVVQKVAKARKTEALAKGFLDFLYSDEAQKIIAKHHFRPQNAEILSASGLPQIETFNAETEIGPWSAIQATHFADGGIYDQITTTRH
ncbi:sulfate ABC transporter substrate-binding protein [Hyphomicrobium methylovorum]|uniref:sulfate ABC transporter substrate-binding protein n=1 Tax=Hyphomicrobium methylovorum TaxID=84 RepID=UPI0015E70FD0|nr:sulfate ABC transporter substrate-binding protein [Hyphomicrobium methylovorum]MBA2125401.1 sulfate ABC transporter substrate-binding protein [Hyphomicrobium methylovorum]